MLLAKTEGLIKVVHRQHNILKEAQYIERDIYIYVSINWYILILSIERIGFERTEI